MIKKYSDIFNDNQIQEIWHHLNSYNWKFWHKSHSDSQDYFWQMDLNDNIFFKVDLFEKIQSLIGNNFFIDRVYANGQTFGLDGNFHIDDDGDDKYTFIYYPMKEWSLSWGGETIIIDPTDNEVKYFYPIPNCGLLFPGNYVHCGRGPSKNYTDLRITIAYKLKKLQ